MDGSATTLGSAAAPEHSMVAFETTAANTAPVGLQEENRPESRSTGRAPAADTTSAVPEVNGSAVPDSQLAGGQPNDAVAESSGRSSDSNSSSSPTQSDPGAAAVTPSRPKMTPLQWLKQTYEQQWKGTVTISTIAADDNAPNRPHWLCSITAAGAVVQDKLGKNVTLDAVVVQSEARNKKDAEHSAAAQIRDMMMEQGWYDPNKPNPLKKGKVGRANRFITDSIASNEANPLAYLGISIDGVTVGRVVIELFRYKKGSTQEEHAPLAVENFLALCRGVNIEGQHRCYAGVPVTRIVPRFLLQTGDVVNRDGTGAAHIHSTYGEHFPDEGLDDKNYRHNRPFMLSVANLAMLNMGLENTNSSQFFITLAPTHELDGHHTCFGKVLAGYGVLKKVESLAESARWDQPPNTVIIQSCGELPAGHDYKATPVLSGGGWPLWPDDQGPPPEGVREAQFRLEIAGHLKEAGNAAYKQGDAVSALARYVQAVRYLSWTTFKIRDSSGDADLEIHESNALWDTEVLLMGNIAAAQLKLGRYTAAADTCQELLHRSPYSVKGLLRAGQAAIGQGSAYYDSAAQHLRTALDQAQKQQLPTREIVAELHCLRDLQQQHHNKQKAIFSAAFARGVLHHPSDDQPSSSVNGSSASIGSNWMFSEGMQHRVADQLLGRRAAGPVSRERVLDNDQPVLVADAWGTHPLIAEPDSNAEDEGYLLHSGLGYGTDNNLAGLSAPGADGNWYKSSTEGMQDDVSHDDAPSADYSSEPEGDYSDVEYIVPESLDAPNNNQQQIQHTISDSKQQAAGAPGPLLGFAGTGSPQQANLAPDSSEAQQPQEHHVKLPQQALGYPSSRVQQPGAEGLSTQLRPEQPACHASYGSGAIKALPQHGLGDNAKPVVP